MSAHSLARFCVLVTLGGLLGCRPIRPEPPERPNRRLHVETHGEVFMTSNGYAVVVLPDRDSRMVRLDVRYPV